MIRTFNWDPLQELEAIRSEINRLFGRGSSGSSDEGEGGMRLMRPAMTAEERDDAYVLTLDMPGVGTDRLEIEVQDRTMRIRGERGGPNDSIHVRYERMLSLPENADPDAIQAVMRDGVLEIVIPKREEARPRRIEVVSESSQPAIEGKARESGGESASKEQTAGTTA